MDTIKIEKAPLITRMVASLRRVTLSTAALFTITVTPVSLTILIGNNWHPHIVTCAAVLLTSYPLAKLLGRAHAAV